MPRDSSVYLEDIITAAERIAGYVTGHTRDSFAADPKTVDAVVRNLEIVGEAVKQVPADLRAQAPDVEWAKVAGLRDILIHAYFNVDMEIVWDIVTNKLPSLEQRVRALWGGLARAKAAVGRLRGRGRPGTRGGAAGTNGLTPRHRLHQQGQRALERFVAWSAALEVAEADHHEVVGRDDQRRLAAGAGHEVGLAGDGELAGRR